MSRFRGMKPSLIIHFYGARFLFILDNLAQADMQHLNGMLTVLEPSHASSRDRVPVTSTFIYGRLRVYYSRRMCVGRSDWTTSSRSGGAGNSSTRHFAHRTALFSFPGNSLLCRLSPRLRGEGNMNRCKSVRRRFTQKLFIKTWQRVKVSFLLRRHGYTESKRIALFLLRL